MTFKLSVTTKVISCGLNWTNMNQAFPNNSLFLLLRFSKKNMLKRGQLICLLITIIYQRKHACWVVITITPPRHASTPRPKWKQPWKPGWFEILPRQESARWFAYINVCKTWTLITKTVPNYIYRGYYTVARRYEFYFRVAKQYFTNERSDFIFWHFVFSELFPNFSITS